MKRLLLITALSLATTACFAESKLQLNAGTKTWSTVEIVEPHQYHCRREYDHWGLIDRTGKIKLLPESGSPTFDAQLSWIAVKVMNSQKTQWVRKLIGSNGQFIPSSDKVEVVNFLTEKRAPVKFISATPSQTTTKTSNQLAFSYCTETGEILKNRFDQVSPFSNGVAAVRIGKSVGFIGLDGQFLPSSKRVECQFKDGLSEGYLAAYVDGHWGYLDTSGNWLVEPVYESAEPFKNDFAQVGLHNSTPNLIPTNSFSYIDKHGKLLKQCFHSTKPFEGGYAAVSILSTEQNSKPLWGLIDKTGQWVLKPKYSRIGPFINSTRLIHDKQLVGIFANGKITVPPQYAHIGRFSEGLASFRSINSDKVGFLDQEGKVVIPAQFAFAYDFAEGYAAVGYAATTTDLESKIGFIDRKGVMRIAPKFGSSSLSSTEQGPFYIQFRDGVCVIPGCQYRHGKYQESGYGYINKAGELLSPVVMTRAFPFSMGRALMRYYPSSGK